MHRRPNDFSMARPAGESDVDSDDDDYFDLSGFRKRNKIVAVDSNGVPTPRNGNGTAGNGNVDEEDWETGEVSSQPAVPQEETWGKTASETVRLACIRGNLEKLKEKLDSVSRYDINMFFYKTEETPLITAGVNGHPEIVEYLLQEKSANPNTKHYNSKITASMAVAASNYNMDEEILLRCAKALVTAGANLDFQDRYGLSAVMIAVKGQRHQLVKFLLESGANPNLTEPDGRTALFFATLEGDGRMCRLLLENGADVNAQDRNGVCVPEVAQDRNFPELADWLFTIRDTKWKPGLHPKLMKELDEEAAAERRARANQLEVKEDSLIEMYLAAVDGTKYLNNFKRHKINYVHFLTLDNDQLKEIGVDEVGVREKLLDTIKQMHNAQWQSGSIRDIANNKNVTAAEAVCMVVNIKEHLDLISSSLMYVNKRIKQRPLALRYDIERNRLEDLMTFCEQSEKSSVRVRSIVAELHRTIGGLLGYTELQIAGKIQKHTFNELRKKQKSSFRWKLGGGVVLGLGVACMFVIIRNRK